MITLKNITQTYKIDTEIITIFNDINLSVDTGQKIAIVGPSGSGKSTLLSLMAWLDTPTSGQVLYDGIDISTFSEEQISKFRNQKIGIIFQSFELVQFFTAYENIMLPLAIRGKRDNARVDDILTEVWLQHRRNNLPTALSGGEQQRVAIARVLASDCDIIFADEPTGNLDATNGKKILDLLLQSVEKKNKTLIIITHDMTIAQQMDIIYQLQNWSLQKI